MLRFVDRADAGRRLAQAVRAAVGGDVHDVVVVGLPRGGVPVAFEVARTLGAPLDVIVVRKLGVPSQPELAMGAVGEAGTRVVNDAVVSAAGVSGQELGDIEERERSEVERRALRFRSGVPPLPLAGHRVVVVDDGLATGSTARAACRIARARGASRVILAVPVGPKSVERRLRPDADLVVCPLRPSHFVAIGQFYDDFAQVSEKEVVDLLHRAAGGPASGRG